MPVWRTLHACNHETTIAGTNHSASHLVLHQVPQEQRWPSKRLQLWMVLKRLSGVELEGCVDTIGTCFRPRYGRPRLCHVTDAVLSPLNLEREGEGGEARQPSGEVFVEGSNRISRRPSLRAPVSQSSVFPCPSSIRLVPSRLTSRRGEGSLDRGLAASAGRSPAIWGQLWARGSCRADSFLSSTA